MYPAACAPVGRDGRAGNTSLSQEVDDAQDAKAGRAACGPSPVVGSPGRLADCRPAAPDPGPGAQVPPVWVRDARDTVAACRRGRRLPAVAAPADRRDRPRRTAL